MTVTYEALDAGHVGTMTCDRGCGATYHDGTPDTTASGFRWRAREAGWRSVRPNEYQQIDICPNCPVEDAPERLFAVGDRVRARRTYNVSWIDDDLAAEGEDPIVRVTIAAGAQGTVVHVRTYVAPFPYVVLFDGHTREVGLIEWELERVAPEAAAVDAVANPLVAP